MNQAPTYADMQRKQLEQQGLEAKEVQRMSAVDEANAMSKPNAALQNYMQGLEYGMTKEDIARLGVPVEFQNQLTDQELQGLVAKYKADQANKISAAQRFMGLESQPTVTPTQIDAWRQSSR